MLYSLREFLGEKKSTLSLSLQTHLWVKIQWRFLCWQDDGICHAANEGGNRGNPFGYFLISVQKQLPPAVVCSSRSHSAGPCPNPPSILIWESWLLWCVAVALEGWRQLNQRCIASAKMNDEKWSQCHTQGFPAGCRLCRALGPLFLWRNPRVFLSEEIISGKQNKGSPARFLEPSFDFIVQWILLWLWRWRPALLCRVLSLSVWARGDVELGARVFGASEGRCWGQAWGLSWETLP